MKHRSLKNYLFIWCVNATCKIFEIALERLSALEWAINSLSSIGRIRISERAILNFRIAFNILLFSCTVYETNL